MHATLWPDLIHLVIQKLDSPAATGRNRTGERAAFDGIIDQQPASIGYRFVLQAEPHGCIGAA